EPARRPGGSRTRRGRPARRTAAWRPRSRTCLPLPRTSFREDSSCRVVPAEVPCLVLQLVAVPAVVHEPFRELESLLLVGFLAEITALVAQLQVEQAVRFLPAEAVGAQEERGPREANRPQISHGVSPRLADVPAAAPK